MHLVSFACVVPNLFCLLHSLELILNWMLFNITDKVKVDIVI